MQKPHCTAPFSRNADWRRLSRPPCGEALDGGQAGAVGLGGEHEARVDDALVEANRAGAALAHEAALLGAGQVQLVAQHFEQRVVWLDAERALPAVDRERDRDHAAISLSRAVTNARSVSTRSIASR
jgi:hypothetical protein